MAEDSTTFWLAARAMARTTATRSVSYMRNVTFVVGSFLAGLTSGFSSFLATMAALLNSTLRGRDTGV